MNRIIIALLFLSVVASAQVNISPNMGMPVPVPGQTIGPDWAQDINASLSIIDSHNHSSGQGVQIQPNGININTDLPFSSNNATQLRSSIYTPQVSPLATPTDIGSLYVVGNELYYNDVTGGNQIQITNNGTVNAGAGSISGLPSGTASASYSAGTFVWQSATSTAANMDARSYILRNSSASSKGLTLNPPAAMAADITETLPTIPAATKIMQMDSSGNFSAAVDVDNSTIQWISNTLSVPPGGITNTNLAANSVATANIQAGAVTLPKLAPTVLQWNSISYLTAGTFSFSVPSNVNAVYAVVLGGGGGGQSGGTTQVGGSGGGGSVPITQLLAVTAGESLSVVVGAGGAGAPINTLSGNGASGSPGALSSISRGTVGLITTSGGTAGIATPSPSSWTPSVMNVAGGIGGAAGGGSASDGHNGTPNFYASGGLGGRALATTRGGGGGGGAGLSFGGIGGQYNTVTFVFGSPITTTQGTVYTNNGQTFYVKQNTTASTTLLCNYTGNPAASGTLTYVSGPTPGNLTFASFTVAALNANKFGGVGVMGGGGGGGGSGNGPGGTTENGGAGGNGGDGVVLLYWLGN